VKRNGSKQRRKTIQVWTYEQARHVLPYVGSIMRTLRNDRLEAQQHHLKVSRMKDRPGRLDRDGIIAVEESTRCAQEAEHRFHDGLEELHTLDIYCLDPIRGLALIPFARGEQLAWFIFDLFDDEPMRYWRYHQDSLETRRPIVEIPEGPSENSTAVV
jgi:hypothetical protein